MGASEACTFVPEQGTMPEKEQMDAETRTRLEQMAEKLLNSDAATVQGFGARQQQEFDSCSELALQQMLREDVKPLEGTLERLAAQIRACSLDGAAKGLFAKLTGGAASLRDVRAAYERAIPEIDRSADDMTDRRIALTRDSAMLERLYAKNEAVYRELCSLILIGNEAISRSTVRSDDSYTVSRLERRVQDLLVTKVASTQLAAQIRMVQESDRLACERLQAALEITIPLWRAQMAAVLGMARANESLRAGAETNERALNGIRNGNDEFHRQAAEFAGDGKAEVRSTSGKLLDELSGIVATLEKRTAAAKENGSGAAL